MSKSGDFQGIDRRKAGIKKPVPQTVKPRVKLWTLGDGKEVEFEEKSLTYEQVKNQTFVKFKTNGRNQDTLTPAAVKRLESMDNQQFIPAIGVEREGGMIEILDGSSRRAYFLLKKGEIKKYDVMIAKDDITQAQANWLTKNIRTYLPLSLYEIGMNAKFYGEQGWNQERIAEQLHVHQSTVSRGLKTTPIPQEVMNSLSNINDLVWKDYSKILELIDGFDFEGFDFELLGTALTPNELYTNLIKLLNKPVKPAATEDNKAVPLVEFNGGDKRKKAEIKLSKDGRTKTFRFARLSEEEQSIIDQKMAEAAEEIKKLQASKD